MLAINFSDLDNGYVKGTSTKVIDCHLGIAALFIQPVGEGCGCRLIDDALNFKAGDFACVLGRLALRVVEVRRDCDHRFGNVFAEVLFGGFLHFLERFSRHLGRRKLLVFHLDPRVAITGADD